MGADLEEEFEEVANIVRGHAVAEPDLHPALQALEARLGQSVITLTFGSMNHSAGGGMPGVEVATMTAWVRGASPNPTHRREAEVLVAETVAEFGPWPWQRFTARAVRAGDLRPARNRRIAALTGSVTDPILSGLGYFDEEAASRAIARVSQERWRSCLVDSDDQIWTVRANAELRRISIFVQTERQAARLRQTPQWPAWEQRIRALLDEEDEFGSVRFIPATIALESREAFESDYQSNWSYYWH